MKGAQRDPREYHSVMRDAVKRVWSEPEGSPPDPNAAGNLLYDPSLQSPENHVSVVHKVPSLWYFITD